jgi:F-type H+-transporting ATPase subunit b
VRDGRAGERFPEFTMDATLHALGDILLRAVPTFLLVLLLHFYLKSIFFKPLERVLEKRYEATEGARKVAEESLKRASEKTAEYEAALRTAKAEVYQAQEQLHKRLQDNEADQLAAARKRTEAMVKAAKDGLAADVAAARQSLAGDAEMLAGQIADTVLRRSAA